jgi:hypothetical protein
MSIPLAPASESRPFQCSWSGLSLQDVESRLHQCGRNELTARRKVHPPIIFLCIHWFARFRPGAMPSKT